MPVFPKAPRKTPRLLFRPPFEAKGLAARIRADKHAAVLGTSAGNGWEVLWRSDDPALLLADEAALWRARELWPFYVWKREG